MGMCSPYLTRPGNKVIEMRYLLGPHQKLHQCLKYLFMCAHHLHINIIVVIKIIIQHLLISLLGPKSKRFRFNSTLYAWMMRLRRQTYLLRTVFHGLVSEKYFILLY